MKTIGVDLHKDSLTVVALDESGQCERREKIATKCRGRIVEFFASYGPQCQVAVESVGFYAWFWDLVQPLVGRMVLANAAAVKKLRPYRDAKTDPKDAAFLARLLYEGRLPAAFAPPHRPEEGRHRLCPQTADLCPQRPAPRPAVRAATGGRPGRGGTGR